jgi:hypothetical protein
MGLNTTPRTWVAGEKPPAATWNTEIRDALTGIQAAWTSYVPSLTNVTLGTGGTVVGNYLQIGKTIRFRALITLGTGGALTGGCQISLPVNALAALGNNNFPVGISSLRDFSAGATVYGGCRMLAAANGVAPVYNATATTSSDCTATAPWTWAVSDTIWVAGEYEAA